MARGKVKNRFDYDDERDLKERCPKAPKQDPQAKVIADFLSKLGKRENTGYSTNWHPAWAKTVNPFTYYFFEDRLVVDVFEDSECAKESGKKRELCERNKVLYVFVDPDKELNGVELAAKLDKTGIKWPSKEA